MNTIKKILLTLVFLSTVNVAFSQVHIGAKAGVNISSASVMPSVVGYDEINTIFVPKIGGNGGLVFHFKINNSFIIQPELVYNTKGIKAKISETFEDTLLTGNWNYTTHYFEVPLLFKYVLGGGGGVGPYLELGGYYSYMFSSRYEQFVKYGDRILYDNDISLTDSYNSAGFKSNRHEFGFKVGLGAEFNVNGAVVYVGLRYSQGLTDIYDYQTEPDGYDKSNNRVFQISVGYLFETTSDETKVYYY